MNPSVASPANYPLALWPAAASANAMEADHLILAFTMLTLMLVVPIFVGITWFALRYREGRVVNRAYREDRDRVLELGWMIIPFVLTLIFFAWGARMFDREVNPPPGALEISAIGKQWMWKFQHPGGQGEINDLHVPVGQNVTINMISQDVIHSLYIPALRIQMETLPGRYTQLWFKADRPGTYRLFCSEFCGTDHSKMAGLLTVMTPGDYQNWLAGAGSSVSMVSEGKALFASYGCGGCHGGAGSVRAPPLAGIYGNPVPLVSGGTVLADDTYLRDKILNPNDNLIAGYKQVMPSFKGLIPEDNLLRIIAYIKSNDPSLQTASEKSP
jgi:cytochrome c oxidase subunit 2